MPAWIRIAIAWLGLGCAATALAAPRATAYELYRRAAQLDDSGDAEHALAAIDEGLASAPNDLRLLGLKGTVLLKLRDYPGALAAYEAYLGAGARGANRREAEKIVAILRKVQSTFLDITVANGPASIYLGSRTLGVFCTASPGCTRPVLPGVYKVIAERPGFERWTGQVTAASDATTRLAVALVERPSLLTVHATPPGARVVVDDAAYDAPAPVAAGKHRVVVSLAGHVDARRDLELHEGKPVELAIELVPRLAVSVAPATATVHLDGAPIAIEDGGIAVPPGAHTLRVTAAGYRDHTVALAADRDPAARIDVQLVEVVRVAAPPPVPRLTPRRKLALAVGGAGLAATAGGVVLGLQSRARKDDAYALCPSPTQPCPRAAEADDRFAAGRSRALAADVAFGVAAGAAVTAAVLWLTGAPEQRIAVTPQLGAVAGLDLAVRF